MRTVKVRIAVGVDPTGNWNSCGWKSNMKPEKYDQEAIGLALDPLEVGENIYWLEAELNVPESTIVEPTVTAAVARS